MTDAIDPKQIRDNLKTLIIGNDIRSADSVESTNDWAKELLAAGSGAGLVVLAESQSAGRGRHGRAWVSPPGQGLYLSVLLAPPEAIERLPLLTLMAGVAAERAAAAYCQAPVGLKWPNDLVINRRKLGGILLEYCPEPVPGVVAGIGLNVNNPVFPGELAPLATSIRIENGAPVDRSALLASLIARLDKEYEAFLLGDDAGLIDKWSQRSSMFGEPVRIDRGKETFEGTAERLDALGHLVVKLPDGSEQVFDSGEVTLCRPAGG